MWQLLLALPHPHLLLLLLLIALLGWVKGCWHAPGPS
jgi:hypothetical protein